jgi:mannose-6-phosphate isomerase
MSLQKFDIKSNDKAGVIEEVKNYFEAKGYTLTHRDLEKPWGFYFYIDPAQTKKFAAEFFKDVELTGIDANQPLQPKVLVFEPGKRLSWQYHHRRAEIWRCLTDKVWVVSSPDDNETEPKTIKFGDVVNSTPGIRHRAGSTDGWGAVVEIWQHTDPKHLSDEEDIVRVEDDYGRSSPESS